jgi:hypothetical protein
VQFLDISKQSADRALDVLGCLFSAELGEDGAGQERRHVLVAKPLPVQDDGEVGRDADLQPSSCQEPALPSEAQPSSPDADVGHAGGENRRGKVDQFILKVKLAKLGRKIIRKDIWTMAGYGDRTEFERYQRYDKRTTQAAVTNFDRVLKMTPEGFMQALRKKKDTA